PLTVSAACWRERSLAGSDPLCWGCSRNLSGNREIEYPRYLELHHPRIWETPALRQRHRRSTAWKLQVQVRLDDLVQIVDGKAKLPADGDREPHEAFWRAVGADDGILAARSYPPPHVALRDAQLVADHAELKRAHSHWDIHCPESHAH